MQPTVASQGVQASSNVEASLSALKLGGNFYSQRKDVAEIKNKLQNLVPEEQYWKTLASYLHGICSKSQFDNVMHKYLVTDESKYFHNELLRRIIFNAHFSCIPPPGVQVNFKAKIKPPIQPLKPLREKDIKPIGFKASTAFDLGYIPSANDLSIRVNQLLEFYKINADQEAIQQIYLGLRNYISKLLKKSYELISSSSNYFEPKTISTNDILYALKSNDILSSIVSISVISKYSPF